MHYMQLRAGLLIVISCFFFCLKFVISVAMKYIYKVFILLISGLKQNAFYLIGFASLKVVNSDTDGVMRSEFRCFDEFFCRWFPFTDKKEILWRALSDASHIPATADVCCITDGRRRWCQENIFINNFCGLNLMQGCCAGLLAS